MLEGWGGGMGDRQLPVQTFVTLVIRVSILFFHEFLS